MKRHDGHQGGRNEGAGANVLRVNGVVLVGRPYRGTIALLQRQGYDTVPLSLSEVGKLDGGLSCLSLRWHEDGRSNHARLEEELASPADDVVGTQPCGRGQQDDPSWFD